MRNYTVYFSVRMMDKDGMNRKEVIIQAMNEAEAVDKANKIHSGMVAYEVERFM